MRIPTIDPELKKIADTLIRNGKKAYLVGGAVRDAILKRPVTDFDIATDATPQESMRLFPGQSRQAYSTEPSRLSHAPADIRSK